MLTELPRYVWLVLLALFFMLAQMVVRVLYAHYMKHVALHDVIRQARLRRNEYLRDLMRRESDVA